MRKFLEDLQRRGETMLQLEEAIGNTCPKQIRFLCESLGQTDLNLNILLQYYYLLGEKGLSNLLVTQTITFNALAKMYNKNFNLLLLEARTQQFQENAKLIYLFDTFTGAQV
ncbi:16550_t:CDS:2, partial [Dentiscutata heterogama]